MVISYCGTASLYFFDMKTCRYCLLFLIIMCVSCSSPKQDVSRISNPSYTVVTDSIYTRLPGDVLYQNGYLYWFDPFSAENFLHVVNAETGKEEVGFGNMGQGPTDFSFPMFSLSSSHGIYVNDLNKNLEILYQWNAAEDTLSVFPAVYKNNPNAFRISCIDDQTKILLCPENEKLFDVITKSGETVSFGDRPIKDDILNAYDVFKGCLAYNPLKNLLLYANNKYPYIAVYKRNSWNDWTLSAEHTPECGYRIVEGELNFDSDTSYGSLETALTKDYIVLSQFDFEAEEFVERDNVGRDVKSMPRSLFVYDYELNLKQIINFSFPVFRMCGDPKTNTVYAIIVNPEYELIKIEL